MTDPALRLAIDVGPLYGHQTGVGVATPDWSTRLAADRRVALDPYRREFPIDTARRASQVAAARHRGVASVVTIRTARAPTAGSPRRCRPRHELRGTTVEPADGHLRLRLLVPRTPDDLANPLVRRAGRRLRRSVAGRCLDPHQLRGDSRARTRGVGYRTGRHRPARTATGPPRRSATAPDGLDLAGRPFILAIGTEERRKNLPTVARRLRRLAATAGSVRPRARRCPRRPLRRGRRRLAALADAIAERVHRLGPVDDWDQARGCSDMLPCSRTRRSTRASASRSSKRRQPVLPSWRLDVGSIAEIGGDGVALVGARPTSTAWPNDSPTLIEPASTG